MVLVCDFDETLFDKNYKNNIKAVNEFVQKNNIFIIATARSFKELQRDLDSDLKFSYLICNNGAMIFDRYFNLIYRKDLKDEYNSHIFQALKESVCVGNPLVDLGYTLKNEACKNANVIKARIINREKAETLKNNLSKKYPESRVSFGNSSILFTDASVNKGNALKILGKLIKVKPRHMHIIGDNINDIEMCKIGNGYAMENGSMELIKVCKKTVKSVEELIDSL